MKTEYYGVGGCAMCGFPVYVAPPQPKEPEQEPRTAEEKLARMKDELAYMRKAQPEREPVELPPVRFEKVAEGIEVGYDFLGGVDIRIGGEFVYVHINYDYRYTHNAARKALADQIVGLLTTPPQRTAAEGEDTRRAWVGLTDKEIDDAIKAAKKVGTGYAGWVRDQRKEYAKAIEAKLKEKNT